MGWLLWELGSYGGQKKGQKCGRLQDGSNRLEVIVKRVAFDSARCYSDCPLVQTMSNWWSGLEIRGEFHRRAGLCLQFSISSAVFLEIFTGADSFLNTPVHTHSILVFGVFWFLLSNLSGHR